MLRKGISVVAISLLLHFTLLTTLAASTAEKESAKAAKVRQGIAKLGIGEKSLVKVKLHNGTKLQGYVSAIEEQSFSVTDPATGVATVVPYPQVGTVQGNNLSTGAKIAIGIGILLAVALIIFLVADKSPKNAPL